MEEIKCVNCNELLYEIDFEVAVQFIKGNVKCECPKCNEVNIQDLSKGFEITEDRIAKVGEKIRVIKFSCLGWGKTKYEIGSTWVVTKVKTRPFGVTFCKGANSPIWNNNYVVITN